MQPLPQADDRLQDLWKRPAQFQQKLTRALVAGFTDCQRNNTDYWRFPASPLQRVNQAIKAALVSFARRRGFIRIRADADTPEYLLALWPRLARLEELYGRLADEASRDLLIRLLAFRVHGPDRVKLPLNDSRYWKARQSVNGRYLKKRHTATGNGWTLNRYRIRDIECDVHPTNVLATFLLEQYACYRAMPQVVVQPGDIVIEGGACWGDTTLYFAEKAGVTGRVYAFEFTAENLEILRGNLGQSPHLAPIVQVVPHAMWHQSDETLSFDPQGPATRLQSGTTQVSTLSIDDFVRRHCVPRVDFIKMDIEGAELQALRGAEQTIRTFRPKLAISVYHNEDDLVDIPEYLHGLDAGYRFYLDHFTIHREETMLFAAPA